MDKRYVNLVIFDDLVFSNKKIEKMNFIVNQEN